MGESVPKQSSHKMMEPSLRSRKTLTMGQRNCQAVPAYPVNVQHLLRSRRRPNRLLEIYAFLERKQGWYSAEDINREVHYVKRTLQGILNKLVERNLIRKTRSLDDARITLFSAVSVEELASR